MTKNAIKLKEKNQERKDGILIVNRKRKANFINQETGYVRGASIESRLIDNAIDAATLKIRQLYDQLCINEDYVSTNMVKQAYQGKREREKTLMEVIDFVIDRVKLKVAGDKRSPATLTKWNTAKDKVVAFLQSEYKAKDIPLSKVKMSFAEDFVDYLTLKEHISNNTTMCYLKKVRSVLKTAVEREWLNRNTLSSYQCSYIEPEKDILDEKELFTLYKKKMAVEHQIQFSELIERSRSPFPAIRRGRISVLH
ncbi:phage integrase SAM-like domain-containing protein [Mucilaginibacter pocheonensis]|uniref:Phage integrase SAM-like domain-containing protein n=1 Tax=Mucilaginibacter pocheonensis TaxID=398050 RepID=A0ABU1TCE8_9SPHI|nr:phage integrase SAM-like domain-containing protein [Mucilaginibacter pocheonensis]MDR6942941.1 hypothetical protein [Mucilaginibacter pocheonensis]